MGADGRAEYNDVHVFGIESIVDSIMADGSAFTGRTCLRHVKVMLPHVSERGNLHTSISWSNLVT